MRSFKAVLSNSSHLNLYKPPVIRPYLSLCGFNHTMEQNGSGGQTQLKVKLENEERKTSVHEQLKRVNQLPPNSSCVAHRLRVLHKLLQLISVQTATSQEEELELLFAGLSF